jgi:hypothetical protein
MSSAFLLASEDFITILDKQTATVFRPIKSKYRLNMENIMSVYTKNPEVHVNTLDKILKLEKGSGCKHTNCGHASYGVIMLARAFCFIYRTFDNALKRDDMELNEMFQNSYRTTLGPFHDAVSRNLFAAAMSMCPNKQAFFAQLQCKDSIETTKADASRYFAEVKRIRDVLIKLCRSNGWDVCE